MNRPDNNSMGRVGPMALEAWHFRAVAALLLLTFVTGGGSYDRGPGDVLAQLAALAVLRWSLRVAWQAGDRRVGWAMATAGLVLAIVALQLLPLPVGLWRANPARAALLADLSRAGVERVSLRWSLTPAATERGLWSLMPALALFASALMFGRVQRRWMVLAVIGLTVASVVLGYVQAGAPQDSLLNFFPEWSPAFNGVFASPNHQATAIAVALMLSLALLLASFEQSDKMSAHWQRFTLGATGVFLIAALPFTGSRAVGILAILGLLVVAWLSGVISRAIHATGRFRFVAWLGVGTAALLAIAVTAAGLQWIRVDAQHEVRAALAMATFKLGWQLAPWGGGVGSFVPWFDQFAPDRLFAWEYYNHAHNEFMQWWLESGVLGLLALTASSGWLVWSRPSAKPDDLGGRAEGAAVGSWVAILVVLAHSGADYPMRTPTMMAVTALLAGIVLAAAFSRSAALGTGKISRTTAGTSGA